MGGLEYPKIVTDYQIEERIASGYLRPGHLICSLDSYVRGQEPRRSSAPTQRIRRREERSLTAQSWERSERRRLIKLLSAGWLPPSVFSSRGFPRSRGRVSGVSSATSLATGVPHLSCSAPGSGQRDGETARLYAGATSRPMAHRNAAISRAIAATTTGTFLPAALRRR